MNKIEVISFSIKFHLLERDSFINILCSIIQIPFSCNRVQLIHLELEILFRCIIIYPFCCFVSKICRNNFVSFIWEGMSFRTRYNLVTYKTSVKLTATSTTINIKVYKCSRRKNMSH